MKVYRDSLLFDGNKNGWLTMGVFDGFHLGHQKLIDQTIQKARQKNSSSVLYTFDPHPMEVLFPEKKVTRLFPIEHLIQKTRALGLDYLVVQKFSKKFSQITDQSFFHQYVGRIFCPSGIIVGYDFHFGFKRQGGALKLKKWQTKYNYQLEIVKPVKILDQIVSSSLLRQAYRKNDFVLIQKFLGEAFSFSAQVVPGEGRGRLIGFPTVNLQTASRLPQKGVYVCRVRIKNKSFKAVMNVGHRPTFEKNGSALTAEAHIIEPFSLQGCKKVDIEVLCFLRDEKKFSRISRLSSAIHQDIVQAKNFFQNE